MNATKRLKANELVMLLSGLLNFDVDLMARVCNVPAQNLRSWLSGKKDNLRAQSVISLMRQLGLVVDNGIRLDSTRVHFWSIHDGAFGSSKAAYGALTALSKLLANCSITAVQPPNASWMEKRTNAYYLISGQGVRVVVNVTKGMFKKLRISPEIVKGASWRDDSETHTIMTSAQRWANLVDKDLTSYEFDAIYNQVEETVSWSDVSLMAREFGVTPADAAQWIADTHGGSAQRSAPEDDSNGMDLEGGGRLLFFVANNDAQGRRAA